MSAVVGVLVGLAVLVSAPPHGRRFGRTPAAGGLFGVSTSGRSWWTARAAGGDAARANLQARGRARATAGDPALLLDLVAVALSAGAPVPAALAAVGAAWPGAAGEEVARAARALELGAPWEVAWAGASSPARAVADALAPSWLTGASPVPLLRAAAARSRAARRAATRTAAGRLGVRLVLPLGLCFLPAFLLLGLVPVVVSLAAGLFG